jgi:hypothetical protein
MSHPELSLIPGAQPRGAKPKGSRPQEAIARRWRSGQTAEPVAGDPDVIPLLNAWIRRLERETRPEPIEIRS